MQRRCNPVVAYVDVSDGVNVETITQDPTGADSLSAPIGDPVSMLLPS